MFFCIFFTTAVTPTNFICRKYYILAYYSSLSSLIPTYMHVLYMHLEDLIIYWHYITLWYQFSRHFYLTEYGDRGEIWHYGVM